MPRVLRGFDEDCQRNWNLAGTSTTGVTMLCLGCSGYLLQSARARGVGEPTCRRLTHSWTGRGGLKWILGHWLGQRARTGGPATLEGIHAQRLPLQSATTSPAVG